LTEEESHPFWNKVFGGEHEDERDQKAVEYVRYRLHEGAHLDDMIQEEYVRRNVPEYRIRELVTSDSRIVEAARQGME